MINIESYLQTHKEQVEAALETALHPHKPKAEIVYRAMEYSLLAGGKRLRPVLFLAVLEAFGKDTEPYLPFACGLEMIHTYSLIHDDLPAMDNDELRRGQPTCHVKFGEDYAILAGDGLLTHSFALMLSLADALPAAELPLLLHAVRKVSLSAGLDGMLTGQVVDIASEGKELTLDELRYIHSYKTGALFSSAIVAAGILAGASEQELEALSTYADRFGVAFQIEDDILDVVGDQSKLGKPIGSDAKNAKATYPALIGLEAARQAAAAAAEAAVAALAPLGGKGEVLTAIATHLLSRES